MFATHLTRGQIYDDYELSPVRVLANIIEEQVIHGSTTESGFIVGDEPAVCFHGTPLPGLAKNVHYEKEFKKVRYTGNGIAFLKDHIYKMGGRPVFYEETESAKKILPRSEWWRIVNFDLSDPDDINDWTHEREWRIPRKFSFEVDEALVVLEDQWAYDEFTSIVPKETYENLAGVTSMAPSLW
jgi:hypothetical protein